MTPSPIAQKHSPTRVTCSPSAGYVELKQAVEAPKAGPSNLRALYETDSHCSHFH